MRRMPTETRWGKLFAGALASLASCTASPPPPAAPLPLPPAAPATSALVAPPSVEAPTFGPLVRLLTEEKPSTEEVLGEQVWLRYGRGMFRYLFVETAGSRFPPCALKQGGPECGVFSISTIGTSPTDEGWRTSDEPAGAKKSANKAIPAHWTAFSPGKDGVYAYQEHAKKIERIDDQGMVTTFLEDDALEQSSVARIYEVGGRTFVLFNEDDVRTHLAEVDLSKDGNSGRRGKTIELPMSFIPGWRQSAQGVRQVEENKKMAMLGGPSAVVLPDGKDAWALVWAEGLAPPYNWAHNKPYTRKKKRGAKHECGGPSSRPLTDKSIEKRIHITRFKGLTQKSDMVLRSTNDYEEVRDLITTMTTRGVEINGVTYDDQGKEVSRRKLQQSRPQTVHLSTDERILAFTYNELSKQGLLLFRSGDTSWRRAFDAQGAFLGAAVPTKLPEDLDAETVTQLEGRWYGLSRDGKLLSLEEDRAFDLKTEASPLVLVSQGPKKAMVFANEKDSLIGIPIDLASGQRGTPEPVLSWSLDERPLYLSGWLPATTSDPVRVVSTRIDPQSSKITSIDVAPLAPKTSWTPLWKQESTASGRVQFHRVPGDLVWALKQDQKTTLRWLKAGKSIQIERDLLPLDEPERNLTNYGPLMRTKEGNWELLSSRPEAPLQGEQNLEVTDGCAHAIRTGPTTLVLLCGEGGEGDTPAFRLGLRRMTLPEGTP